MKIGAVLTVLVLGIVAGTEGSYDPASAYPGLIPYHAGIFEMKIGLLGNMQYLFLCSGAVIHNEYVLTTASCVDSLGLEIAVAVGSVNTYNENNTYVNVTEVIKHFMYTPGEHERDIALLKISPGFQASEYTSPVFIQEDSITTGTNCTVSGWRKDLLTLSSNLQYATTTIKQASECTYIAPGEICAGAPTGDLICQLGDEGSPIVCNGLLSGVMHYNTDICYSEPQPGVYSEVAYHKDWIRSNVDLSGVTTTSSTTTTTEQSSTAGSSTARPVGVYETVVADVGDVPYQAAVFTMNKQLIGEGYSYFLSCAGVVVDEQFVVTTATCAESAAGFDKQMAVAAGFVDQDAEDIEYYNVTQVIQHPDYNQTSGDYDIALLRIQPSFLLTANVSAIALSDVTIAKGVTCRVSGWKEDLLTVSRDLKYGNVSTTTCEDVNDVSSDETTGGQHVCGGIPEEADSEECILGDEGAPLVCGGLLAGIYRYNIDNCLHPTSGVYHDVSQYKQWITDQLSTTAPPTSDGTTESTSTSAQSTTVAPTATTLSTTDHTTGLLGGGEGGGSTLSSSIVAIVLLLVLSYLN